MNYLASVMKLAKEFTVLYAEDDLQTQRAMKEILTTFFKHVYVANDGQEGLELYQNNHPDLIISDINMPRMNGLEMVTAIRSADAEIPVMIVSAYNDTEYLMDSIFLGIDRYATKPLKDEEFFKNLLVLLKNIHQKREAQMYEKERINAQINEASLSMLKETTDIYPSPTFVFGEDQKLVFLNRAASRIFSTVELEAIHEGACIDAFVSPKEGYLSSIYDAKEDAPRDAKVILKSSGMSRIFLVKLARIEAHAGLYTAVSLTDITRVEYEKQKSQNLSAYLHDLLREFRHGVVRDINTSIAQKEAVREVLEKEVTVAEEPAQPVKEKSYDYVRLTAMHPSRKESAKEYIESLDSAVMDELDEMEELEKEMSEAFVELEEHFNLSTLHSIGRIYGQYARMIGMMMDFEDVSYSLKNLSDFLLELQSVEFNQRKMAILLQAISEDLVNWRETIFVKQESNDIHYLDASLLSSCLQIKMDFGEGESEDEGDDLELF